MTERDRLLWTAEDLASRSIGTAVLSTQASIYFRTPRAKEWRIRWRYQRDWASNKDDKMVNEMIDGTNLDTLMSIEWEKIVMLHYGKHLWEDKWIIYWYFHELLLAYFIERRNFRNLNWSFKFIKELGKLSLFGGAGQQGMGFLKRELFPYHILHHQKREQTMSPFLLRGWDGKPAPPEFRHTGSTCSKVTEAHFNPKFTRQFVTIRVTAANLKAILNFLCTRNIRSSPQTSEQTERDDYWTDSWTTDAKSNP